MDLAEARTGSVAAAVAVAESVAEAGAADEAVTLYFVVAAAAAVDC